jgi:hypothetical protein
VCPVPYNLAHLVLLEGGRQLQVAQEQPALSLQTSHAEAAKLQPEFDEAGKIVSFHSRAEQL